MVNVGFVGLGKMGLAMALRLIEAGHKLTVWNRTPEKCLSLRDHGAVVAGKPAQLATDSDIIVTMLLDSGAIDEVYNGPDGLLSQSVMGKLFIDMSTLAPASARELSYKVIDKGAAFVDAPVSGTVAPARDGRLLALVGGSLKDVEAARPLLNVLCRRIVHAGPVGQGALLKLAVNLPLAIYWQALAEAVALGKSGGLNKKLVLDTIQDSSAALAVLGFKIPAILGESGSVAFNTASMKKDLLSMLETGKSQGVPMATTEAVLAAYSAAIDAGLGDDDAVSVIRFLADQVTKN